MINTKLGTAIFVLVLAPGLVFAARRSINTLNTRVNQLEAENNAQQSEIDALRASQCALYQQLFNTSLIGALTVPAYCPTGPNTPPTQPGISIAPALPITTDGLVASIDVPSTDADGDTVSYGYTWRKDGVVQGAITGSNVTAGQTQKGQVWEITVTPNDGTDDGPVAVTSVTIQNAPPTQPTVCQITPNPPADADDLLANFGGSVDADSDPVGYKLRWKRDDVAQPAYDDQSTIPGAATSIGEVWEVTIIPWDGALDGPSCSDNVTILN